MGRAVEELASGQHGVLARAQLIALGLAPRAIDEWVACRRLVVVHRGVYAVGSRRASTEGRWLAAVLVGGDGAALSHLPAADLHELTRRARPLAHVTVSSRRRSRPGIVFHQHALPADETTIVEAIPVTSVARTLLDLASVVSRERLRQAISLAEHRLLADSPSLADLIERYPRRRGLGNLRVILTGGRLGLDLARSELEIEFLEFLDEHDLPRPEVNAVLEVGGRSLEVDCCWREAGLVVELDSRAHHGDWAAAENDRARDLALLAAGYRCARVTQRRLREEAGRLAAELRSAMGRVEH